MVAPITGPINSSLPGSGTRLSYWQKVSWKQAKPYDRVLPYNYRRCDLQQAYSIYNPVPHDAFGLGAGQDILGQIAGWKTDVHLRNLLYDRFKEKMSNSASLGVSLAEIGQSYGMIASRASQLLKFGRALRSGRFGDAAESLGLRKVPKGVSRKRQASSNYLEFHFGWSPLVADIYDAADVLQNPLKTTWVRATAQEDLGRMDLSAPVDTKTSNAIYRSETKSFRYWKGVRRIACGAEVSVSNPNLWLANQMGLINPATIALDLVPFSFVADWFMNFGQVLGSFSDYYGLTLTKTWTTTTFRGTGAYYDFFREAWSGTGFVWVGGLRTNVQGTLVHTDRQVGLPKPTFAVRPYKAWGLRRAAAAVSLLTLQLDAIQRGRNRP